MNIRYLYIYILFFILSACCEKESFSFMPAYSLEEEIEVIPLTSHITMVSCIPGISTYFTKELVEDGKNLEFKEGTFLNLSDWVTVWNDSNGKKWELRDEFEEGISYSLLLKKTLKLEDGRDKTIFRYTGLSFTTPEYLTCPYIGDVECELVEYSRLEKRKEYDSESKTMDFKDTYSTVVKLNLPQKIPLPNGDYLMPNDLYMEVIDPYKIIHSYQKYDLYDYWEEDGMAYITFPMLDKDKYCFELNGSLSLHSDNNSYGENVGSFQLKVKNTLDLTNVK